MGGSAPRAHSEVGEAVTVPSALGAMPGQAPCLLVRFPIRAPPRLHPAAHSGLRICRQSPEGGSPSPPPLGPDAAARGQARTATPRPRARNPMPTWPRSPARPQALTLLRCLSPGRRSHSSRLASEELRAGERVAGFSQ